MSLAKLLVACGILAVVLSACGIQPKPLAGSPHVDRASGNHAFVDDPRTAHLPCLRSDHLSFRRYRTKDGQLPAIQVGTPPSGPTIVFLPTTEAATYAQMSNQEQGAEVIGQALVYPNHAGNQVMAEVEQCVALKVEG